jgi:aldehyde dehydrogenase (NAD+)
VISEPVDLPSRLLIGGELLADGSGGTHEHRNPASGQIRRSVPLAGPAEIDRAVRSAREAFDGLRRWSPDQRRAVLLRLAELIRRDSEAFVITAATEIGTPVSQQRPRMASTVARFDYFAGWIDKLYGETIPLSPERVVDFTVLEPVGVVAKILTWNSPLGGIGIGVAPPLAVGCTIIIKSPELAPFAALRFGQLCLEAGLPPGVVNVVCSGPEASRVLVSHPEVDKISFTGGPAAAAII